MSKRLDEVILSLYRSLFDDLAQEFPELEAEFGRDLERLRNAVQNRGPGVVLSDLPELGKHLDRCLDEGTYVASNLPLSRPVSASVVIPRFARGLYLRIFEPSGSLKEAPDVPAVRALRQIYRLVSKCKLVCSDDKVANAIRAFLEVDLSLPEPSGLWSDQAVMLDPSRLATFDHLLKGSDQGRKLLEADPDLGTRLDRIFARISTELGPYDPLLWDFRHGPGVVAGKLNNSGCKYQWCSWPERLEAVFPIADCGYYSYSSWLRHLRESWEDGAVGGRRLASPYASDLQTSESSRLIAVPKTYDKPRLIAAEPASHQWCQQSLLSYFYERVGKTWIGNFIAFRDQTRNQVLCRQGSVDGSLATLDLSDASDRVTCGCVEAAFRCQPTVLRALAASRTRFVRVSLDGNEITHELRKFSTMGNAVTFPVESIIFLGIALAVSAGTTPRRSIDSLRNAVSVFGDDIIVPATDRERLEQVLEALCFKVNRKKTFSKGQFRESCGLDVFAGSEVTPVYIRHLYPDGVESMVSMTETANHFYQRWQLNVSGLLRRTVRERIKSIPDVHNDSTAFGFKTRVCPTGAPQYRWNKDLQRVEVFVGVPKARKPQKDRTDGDAMLFQYFTEKPSPQTEWEAGFTSRPGTKLKIRTRWVPASDLYGAWLG